MIVLTGGGTGGHLSIVRSVKEELNEQGVKPVFIGSSNGQDKEWFEHDDGFEAKYFFDTKGVVNKSRIKKIASLLNILKYSLFCYKIFKKHNTKKVLSVGGYSAAAASFAAIMFKKELYIHEQNAKMGTLNQKLKPYAKEIFSSYIKNSKVKDYPVAKEFFKMSRVRRELKTVIFLGGSQGANFINELAKELSSELLQNNISVIHQCGKKSYNKMKEFYTKNNLQVELYGFIEDMPSILNRADLAVSRSGASTLWELCASKLPAIFIPYPYAAGDHQYYNAKFLETKKLSFVVREKEATKENILQIIKTADINKMSQSLSSIINQNGAKKIANILLEQR
jgi:UDP-N-acetylglucosamine--N-acetylmuramyl-(pentapeptide) pyrophosphoryl-undecaprenol N-acetylglucosamine transferase